MKSDEKGNFWDDIFSIKPIDFYVAQIAIIFLLILSIGFMLTIFNLDERLKKIEMDNNLNTIIKFDNTKKLINRLPINNNFRVTIKNEDIIKLSECNK